MLNSRYFILAVSLFTAFISLGSSKPGQKAEEEGDSKTVIYSPVGKRDPFRGPETDANNRKIASLSALDRYNVEQLQLRAILNGLGKRRAMFEDPDGKAHIVSEGQIIAKERVTVSRILQKGVILTQKTFNYLGEENLSERVISLQGPEEESADGYKRK